MFHVDRAQRLQQVEWNADGGHGIFYLETCQYPNIQTSTAQNYRHGVLHDSEIDLWLKQEGRFKPRRPPGIEAEPLGGFRILMCERPGQNPPSVTLSQASFLQIEKAFDLSPATLPSLFSISGVNSKQYKLHSDSDKIEMLNVVIKATQKVEIANSLLSLSHNFETKWTTALLCGEGVVRRQALDSQYGHRLASILALTQSSVELWTHPLLLPIALLRDCCRRTETSRDVLGDMLVELENDIGVTFAGQARHDRSLENWPADINIKSATIGLHSTGAQIVFVSYVCGWACDCARFLLDLGVEIEERFPSLKRTSMVLREYLAHELSSMSNIDRFMNGYKERVQAQINVLYSAASQRDNAIALDYSRIAQIQNDIARKDNQLNIKIAASTKKDSIAMITFTFITALFLPGTFVSTLFSMPMFNWQAASSRPSQSKVSAYFWVYWAVTIPLTMAVMTGWVLWYKYANRRWQEETEIDLNRDSLSTKQKEV